MTRAALGDAGEQPLAAGADDRGGWQSLVDPISTQSAVALHPAIFALARRTPFTTLGPQADSIPEARKERRGREEFPVRRRFQPSDRDGRDGARRGVAQEYPIDGQPSP